MKQQIVTIIVLALAWVATAAVAQDGQGTVMRALDEPFSLSIEDTPIVTALGKVGQATGLSIRMDSNVLAWLPHGEETRVRITARDVRLSKALTAMLAPMCLEWRVDGRDVVVIASAALRRIGRRPTFTEVEILAKLRSEPLKADAPVVDQLQTLTDIPELRFVWHRMDKAVTDEAEAAAKRRLPCTGATYLDAICHGRGLAWYVWGTDVMIVTKSLQTARQLRRIVSVEYRSRPLTWVINDLARKADLKLKMDPGVMNVVAAETRKQFTLLMDRATLAEAFEAISGATGLVFHPDDLTLRISAASSVAAPATPRQRPAFVMTMPYTAPDGNIYMIMFRPDDLPAAIAEQITKQKAAYLRQLQQAVEATTQPADEPKP